MFPHITLRPAESKDFPAIAALLIQLYQAEVPGALSGSFEQQLAIMQYTLESKNQQGLRSRYVACNREGLVLGTAAMDEPDQATYDRAPPGTIQQAWHRLGPIPTLRLIITVGRMIFGGHPIRPSHAVHFHSVVVEKNQRGRGFGKLLMLDLERIAYNKGHQLATLQVLANNHAAKHLYQSLGYQVIWQSPGWARFITWPSLIMQKELG